MYVNQWRCESLKRNVRNVDRKQFDSIKIKQSKGNANGFLLHGVVLNAITSIRLLLTHFFILSAVRNIRIPTMERARNAIKKCYDSSVIKTRFMENKSGFPADGTVLGVSTSGWIKKIMSHKYLYTSGLTNSSVLSFLMRS